MFDELKKINIKTCPESELRVLIRQTLPIVDLHTQAVQELLNRHKDNFNKVNVKETYAPIKVAIANGHKLTTQEFQNINEDDFDIILDMTSNTLKYRKDPEEHTKLKEAKLNGIGSRRIEILKYLIEHPIRNISIDNISTLPNQLDIVEPNTLSKTISLLRKSIEQKGIKSPYIITERSLGNVHHTYKINPQWHYLVIKENI